MLSHISIKNYALIDSLEIDVSAGLSVITGETGTGKSILLGALGLILGNRADSRVLLNKNTKCIVEGTFEIASYPLEVFFEKNELDYDNNTIIRREIRPNGKSRSFINDTPVKLNLIKELGEKLVDIHSQNQNLALGETSFQLAVIDSYAKISEKVGHFKSEFENFRSAKKELDILREKEKQSNAEKDYLEFVLNELEEAKLVNGDQENLENELNVLNHAEEIKSVLYASARELENEDNGLLNRLGHLKSNIAKISSYSESLDSISKRLDSIFIELSDVISEMVKQSTEINFQPERIDEINDRLNAIYSLQSKHRVNTITELIDVKKEIEFKLGNIQTLENRIESLKQNIAQIQEKVQKSAKEISVKRLTVLNRFAKEIKVLLEQLGMPHAEFKVDHKKLPEAGPYGIDKIIFLFNANRGGSLQELSLVASGGEKSRLMLAMKSMISKNSLLPTIIFDEIDSGVSGAVADKVGNILLQLSGAMQVMTITHLPQIAGKGKDHLLVYKENGEISTKTKIRKLNEEERVLEIAKLLSGQDVTSASVESARHLLKN